MENNSKTVIITGGTSGIGLATAKKFVENNWNVFVLSRHCAEVEGVTYYSVNVADIESVKIAVNSIHKITGRIDVLVNNAGFGISGAIEFCPPEEISDQIAVNFLGAVNCIQVIMPYLREQKFGTIINVSSLAAEAPIPYQAFYSASKAAINSLTYALANEVKQFGIKICAIMPGDTKTGFTQSRHKTLIGNEFYGGSIERSVLKMENDEANGYMPEIPAKVIYRIATTKYAPLVAATTFADKCLVFLMRIFPRKLLNFILGKMYS